MFRLRSFFEFDQIHKNRIEQTHDPTADNIGTADTAPASAMDNFGLNEKVS